MNKTNVNKTNVKKINMNKTNITNGTTSTRCRINLFRYFREKNQKLHLRSPLRDFNKFFNENKIF